MELKEFVAAVPRFATLGHPERILHFAWFLHTQRDKEAFEQSDLRACYKTFDMHEPNFSEQFRRLVEKRPRVMLQTGAKYRLEHKERERIDAKYGQHETTIAVSTMLRDLPGTIADDAQRIFLKEAITCYHNKAFRAAIIMAWNLTYDHMARWIVGDAGRLKAFNSFIDARLGVTSKRAGTRIAKREDFEKLEEKEMIDIMSSAGLLPSKNVKQILEMQLTRRNMVAHPSLIFADAPQADDAITSLVQNVVLALK